MTKQGVKRAFRKVLHCLLIVQCNCVSGLDDIALLPVLQLEGQMQQLAFNFQYVLLLSSFTCTHFSHEQLIVPFCTRLFLGFLRFLSPDLPANFLLALHESPVQRSLMQQRGLQLKSLPGCLLRLVSATAQQPQDLLMKLLGRF